MRNRRDVETSLVTKSEAMDLYDVDAGEELTMIVTVYNSMSSNPEDESNGNDEPTFYLDGKLIRIGAFDGGLTACAESLMAYNGIEWVL